MSDLAPRGWYPDPEAPDQERLWDGHRWTDARRPKVDGTVAKRPWWKRWWGVTAIVLVAMGFFGALADDPSEESTETVAASEEPEPAEEPRTPEPTPSPSSAVAARDHVAAAELVDAWEVAGLKLGEVRDTTRNCTIDGCVQRITTDYVSVYQWEDEALAEEYESLGPGRERHREGHLVAHFGGDSDFWPFDIGPYVDVMVEFVEAGPSADASRAVPAEAQTATLEDRLEDAIGDSNRDIVPRVIVSDETLDGEPVIFVRWSVNDNFTEGLIKAGAKLDATEMLEVIADDADLEYGWVSLQGSFSLVDQLGNEDESPVVRATYPRETVEAINFDGFLHENAWEIADEVWLHPAFRD